MHQVSAAIQAGSTGLVVSCAGRDRANSFFHAGFVAALAMLLVDASLKPLQEPPRSKTPQSPMPQ